MQLKGWKRCMAAFLAVMCVFTSVNVTAFAATGTGVNNNGVWEVTAAKLVASRYDGDEASVITSPAINSGKSFAAKVPTEEDELVLANASGTVCTVAANDYVADGQTWKPVYAAVMDTETDEVLGETEVWTFAEGVNTAEITMTKEPASYYVSVVYAWEVDLGEDEERLLNVPAQLADAKQSMDAVVDLESDLDGLTGVFATIQDKIDDLPVKPEAVQKLSDKIAAAEESADAVLGWIADYAETDFEAAYHWENGAEIKADAVQAWEDINSLYQNVIDNEDTLAQAMSAAVIGSFITTLENLVYEDPTGETENGYLTEVKNAEWSFLSFDPGFTGVADAELDETVANLDADVADAQGTYLVAKEVVSYEVAVTRVNIVLKATVASDEAIDFESPAAAKYDTLDDLTATILLPVGTTKAVVEEKIDAKVEELLAQWEDYGITDSNSFTVTAPEVEIPDVLGEDDKNINWTVTCEPKMFEVDFGGTSKEYPYGTAIYLNEHSDAEQSWDYIVNEIPYEQGEVAFVLEDLTISRIKLPAVKEYRVADVLAEDFRYELNGNEKAILTSPALISDGMNYRLPSSTVATIDLDEGTQKYVVTAANASAGTSVFGEWVPVEVKIMNDKTEVGTAKVENGEASWYADAYTFTKAVVVYEYDADFDEATTLYYLNLPYELKQNVQIQKDLLTSDDDSKWTAEKIYGYFDEGVLEVLTKDRLNVLKMMLGKEAQAAVQDILDNGWSETADEPAVYSNLKAADKEGWSFSKCVDQGYYANICEQVDLFARNLDAIVNDGNFEAMLKTAGYEAKQDQIDDLRDALNELDKRIKDNPLHDAFDQDNGAFAALIETIDKAEDLKQYTEADGINAYADILLAKPGSKTLTISVAVEKQDGKYSTKNESIVVEKGTVISAGTVKAEIAELETALGLTAAVKPYYTASEIDGFPGGEMQADALSEKTWTLNEYVVSVEGCEDKVLRYGDKLYVDLPASTDPNVAYKYFANGEEITDPSGKYWFDNEDLLAFVDGKFTITREETDLKVQAFESFIDAMNDGMAGFKGSDGKPLATFVPVKNADGEYESIVMKLSASKELKMSDLAESAASLLGGMSYGYIGMDNGLAKKVGFKYEDDGMTKLNPQTLIDMFLNGGLDNEALLKMIKADGSVNSMTLPGYSGFLGGKLVESKMYLGNSADDCEEYNFYVTLNPADKKLMKDLRKLLAKSEQYGGFAMDGGAFEIDATIPGDVYKLYLSTMVLLDRFDLDTMEDRQLVDEVEEIKELLEAVLLDKKTPVTASTLQNALNGAGLGVDLMQYEAIVDMLLTAIKDSLEEKETGELLFVGAKGSGASYSFTMQYDMDTRLGAVDMDMSELFTTTKLSIPVYINVWNFNKDFEYEAIVLDVRGNGVKGKLDYVEDLSAKLAYAEGPVYAILLKDIADDLTVNCTTILDLNGKTVKGDVKANAGLRIVSRILDVENAGGVEGTLTGSGSVVVAAGTYSADLGSKVKNGYTQDAETGVVTNDYYQIEDTEEEMTVTVDLEKIMAEIDGGNLSTVALEMVSDIFLNLDTYAGIKIDGDTLYEVDIDIFELIENAQSKDFKGIADQILDVASKEELKDLAKNVASDLTDVKRIAKVLKDGGELSSYTFDVAPWAIKPSVEDGAIKVAVTTDEYKTKTVTLVIEPLSAEQKATLKKIYGAAADIFNVDIDYELGEIAYDNGDWKWSGHMTAVVEADLSAREGEASDYLTVLSLILANNSADKAEFIKDIKLYHNNEWSKDLEARYEALTIGDLQNALEACDGKFFDELIREAGLTGELEKVEELTNIYDGLLFSGSKLSKAVDALIEKEYAYGKINSAADRIDAYRAKPVSGLYDGETGSYSHVSLTFILNLFENRYESKAQAVIDMVNALPEEFSEANYPAFKASFKEVDMTYAELLAAIDAIETAFNALSADAQAIVKAECEYTAKLANIRDYLMVDHRAARAVGALIDALPHMFSDDEYAAFKASGKTLEECECCELNTEEVRAAVKAAREAFDALGRQLGTEEQEWLKVNCDFSKLTNGEDYFNRLDAAALIALLQTISTYTLKMEDLDIFSAVDYDKVAADVAAARALYNGLSDEVKATVPAELLAVLTNAEAYFAKWTPVLQNVIALITALPAEPTDADYEAFMAAKAAFEALYPNSQAYVKMHCEFAKYEACEEYFQIDVLAELKAKIDALPTQFNKADYADHFCVNFDEAWQLVKDADAIWDELGVDNNDLYLNDLGADRINKLTNARIYFSTTAVLDVIAMIEALPEEFSVEYYEEFLARGGKLREDIEEVLYATVDANDAYLDLPEAYLTDGAKAKQYIEGKYEVYQKLLNALDYFADRIGLWIAEIDDEDFHYNGKAYKPKVRVYEGAERLQERVDYTVAYRSNVKAFELADYEAAHKATEDYRAQANADGILTNEEQAELKKLERAEKAMVSKIPAVIVNFKKNYRGSAYRYFNIHKIDLAKAYADADYREEVGLTIQTDVYAAAAKRAKVVTPVITLNGKKVSASEFTVTMLKQVHIDEVNMEWVPVEKNDAMYAGEQYQVVVEAKEGKSNFTNAYTAVQHVDGILMNKVTVSKLGNYTYTGAAITPHDDEGVNFTVKYKQEVLVEGEDYTVSYENNVNVGTAKLTVTGIDGSGFTGTKTITFKINGTKLNSKQLTMPKLVRFYDGDAQLLANGVDYTFAKADGTLMVEGTDYKVTYSKNVNKGTASVVFTGIGNYTGTLRKTFSIKAADLSAIEFDNGSNYNVASTVFVKGGVKPADQIVLIYNGTKLIEGKDYTVSYKNNKTVFTDDLNNLDAKAMKKAPTLTIKGKGNYAGSLVDLFNIEKEALANVTGVAKNVLWKDRAGNFKTTYTLTDLDGKNLSVSDHKTTYSYYYDADPTEGENWVEIDQTNKKAQVPASAYVDGHVDMKIKVTASEKSNYTGDIYLDYHLYTTAISKAKIDRNAKYKFIYNRAEQKFVGEVDGAGMKLYADKNKTDLLVEGEDYEVVYMKNIFAGSAIAEIRGLNEYGASKKITFRIEKNGEAVANLDNRINYFDQISVDQMLSDNLVVYEAIALFEF